MFRFLPLVLKNCWRNRRRTLLTIASISVSMCLLGGSSSMNAMLYVRGRPLDYDSWEAQGAPGWGYSDVLPYFIKSEDNVRGASEYHGVGGPLHVNEQRSPRPLNRSLLAAREAAGIPRIADYNG